MCKKVILVTLLIAVVFCSCYHKNNSTPPDAVLDGAETNQSETVTAASSSSAKENIAEPTSQTVSTTEFLQNTDYFNKNSTNPNQTESRTPPNSAGFVEYKSEKDGIALEVSAPEIVTQKNEFYVTAKVTNHTAEPISYTVPASPDNIHHEIIVTIKSDNKKSFIDRDTFGIMYDIGKKAVVLKPGESYTEKICFIPGWADFTLSGVESADINFFEKGNYSGNATFIWRAGENENVLSLDFPVTVN